MRLVRTDAPATSHAAANDRYGIDERHETRILAALDAAGPAGLTREEVESETGISGNSVRPRLRKLIDDGFVAVDPARTRATRSNRRAEVLVHRRHAGGPSAN